MKTQRKRISEERDDRQMKKKTKHTKEADEGYNIRCRPGGVCLLVENFTDAQKQSLISIGFGGILKVKGLAYIQWKKIYWFIENFNPITRVLSFGEGRNIVVTPSDIEDLFLLPRNEGNPVLKMKRDDEPSISTFLDDFKQRFELGENVKASSLLNLLKSSKENGLDDGGADFIRLFILYALSTFLTPSMNSVVDMSIFRSLVDIHKISSLDWCSFILEKLCKALTSIKDKKNVSGCVLVLPLLYFHQYMWQGIAEDSTLPLIQHWDSKRVNGRLDDELKGGCLFGIGKWVERKYPISGRDGKSQDVALCKAIDIIDREESVSLDDIPVEDDDEKGRFITYKLPRGEKDDIEIKGIAKNALHESYLLLKRDFNVVIHNHLSRLSDIKKNSKKEETTTTKPSPAHSTSPVHSTSSASNSQEIFYDEEFLKRIDELVENVRLMNALNRDDYPKFNLLTPDEVQPDIDNIIRGVTDEVGRMGLNNLDDSDTCVISMKDGLYSEDEDHVELSIADPMHCCPDTDWSIDEKSPFKSIFMHRNSRYLSGLSRREKDIADFCFFCNHRPKIESNVFAHKGKFFVHFSAIQSLRDGTLIESSIIDIWSMVISKTEIYKSWKNSVQIQKFVFNTQHSSYLVKVSELESDAESEKVEQMKKSLKGCWLKCLSDMKQRNDLNTIQMFFVPICFNLHYFAAVISLPQRKIFYLDNQKANCHDGTIYWKIVETLREHFGSFLEESNHPQGIEIRSFQIENVAFAWQDTKKNVDCGVYLLNHMENFVGGSYECPDLTKPHTRKKLRAMYCCRIILSDLNELRSQVLSEVAEFCLKRQK